MESKRLSFRRIDERDFFASTSDRYFDTAVGTLTLIGLSYDETKEFIALNVSLSETDDGDSGMQIDVRTQAICETRWHQLHQKHESARQAWLRERSTPVW